MLRMLLQVQTSQLILSHLELSYYEHAMVSFPIHQENTGDQQINDSFSHVLLA